MSFRFSRHLRIIPGLKLNFSNGGTSVSIGGRGHWVTFGRHSVRATVGLPGTGASWSETVPTRVLFSRQAVPPAAPAHGGHRLAFVLVALALLVGVLAMLPSPQ